MKIRTGFVANSSSSNFFVNLYGVILKLKDVAKYHESFMANLNSLIIFPTDAAKRDIMDMYIEDLTYSLTKFADTSLPLDIDTVVSVDVDVAGFNTSILFVCIDRFLYIGLSVQNFVKTLENNPGITIKDIQDVIYKVVSVCTKDIPNYVIPAINTYEEEYTIEE